MSDGVERDDQTSPFPLEREKEETSPFPLERERSTERDPEATEHAPEAGEESEGEAELPPERATIRFTASARTARRSVVVALGVHSLALLAFASLSLGAGQKVSHRRRSSR